ncbi:hypothetical protein PCE1_000023 [Barthelona sp. PCE]
MPIIYDKRKEEGSKDYVTIEEVGTGSFATVYKARETGTTHVVALKKICISTSSEEEMTKLKKEIKILSRLNCEYIVNLLDKSIQKNEIHIIMEYGHSNLEEILQSETDDRTLPLNVVRLIAFQMLTALDYLHKRDILHRDMKPSNILIMEDNRLKLCDFGFATIAKKDDYQSRSIKGTPLYMSPEILSSEGYNSKTDIWSLGVILYEVLIGRTPFVSKTLVKLMENITQGEVIFPSEIDETIKEFLGLMLEKNPDRRPSAEELLQHEFLEEYHRKPVPISRRNSVSGDLFGIDFAILEYDDFFDVFDIHISKNITDEDLYFLFTKVFDPFVIDHLSENQLTDLIMSALGKVHSISHRLIVLKVLADIDFAHYYGFTSLIVMFHDLMTPKFILKTPITLPIHMKPVEESFMLQHHFTSIIADFVGSIKFEKNNIIHLIDIIKKQSADTNRLWNLVIARILRFIEPFYPIDLTQVEIDPAPCDPEKCIVCALTELTQLDLDVIGNILLQELSQDSEFVCQGCCDWMVKVILTDRSPSSHEPPLLFANLLFPSKEMFATDPTFLVTIHQLLCNAPHLGYAPFTLAETVVGSLSVDMYMFLTPRTVSRFLDALENDGNMVRVIRNFATVLSEDHINNLLKYHEALGGGVKPFGQILEFFDYMFSILYNSDEAIEKEIQGYYFENNFLFKMVKLLRVGITSIDKDEKKLSKLNSCLFMLCRLVLSTIKFNNVASLESSGSIICETFAQQYISSRDLENGVLPFILHNHTLFNTRVITDVVRLLSQLARISQDYLEDLRILPFDTILVDLLSKDDVILVSRTCNLVGNLFRYNADLYTILTDPVNKVVSLLQHTDVDVLKMAAFAVGNAAYQTRLLYRCFNEGLRYLTALCFHTDQKVVYNACGAIGNMLRKSDVLIDVFLEANTMEALMNCLRKPTMGVALFSIANSLIHEPIRAQFVSMDCWNIIKKLDLSSSEEGFKRKIEEKLLIQT